MRRPLLAALLGALVSLMLLFGFSAWLFSRNMKQARQKSEERMAQLALYIGEHIRTDVFSYPFDFKPSAFPSAYAEQQGEWLDRLTRATGLERAVITDSAGLVYAGSQNLITSGESIQPYLIDTALFAAAASDGKPRFTRMSEIDGVRFQSLYFPFALGKGLHMVVLESDQVFLTYVEQFRTYVVFASLFLLILFVLLTAGLFVLDRKFQAALETSRRNEHLAFLGRTSAELAHELKNPLAIIKASVDVLKRKLDPDGKEPAFNYLSDEVMRLSRLIGNILGFSKDRPLESRPFRPREVLLAVREGHRLEFPGVAWIVETPETLEITGDRDIFRQVTDNLGRNASNAMAGQGSLRVTYEPPVKAGGPGRILFTDSGPGLPKHVKAKLFQPFVSGSKTGTGLGLSIIKNLCERAGWSVSLVSDAASGGKPTCFAVAVPGERIAPAP